jgi:hypothetical protein
MSEWVFFSEKQPEINKIIEIRFWRDRDLKIGIGYWSGEYAVIATEKINISNPFQWKPFKREKYERMD